MTVESVVHQVHQEIVVSLVTLVCVVHLASWVNVENLE